MTFHPTPDGLELHPLAPDQMITYLIHLDRPLADHARHYIGMTNNLERRLYEHRGGSRHGSKLLAAANRAGIPWRVVGWWEGGHEQELEAKSGHDGGRHCPICSPESERPGKPRPAVPDWKRAQRRQQILDRHLTVTSQDGKIVSNAAGVEAAPGVGDFDPSPANSDTQP